MPPEFDMDFPYHLFDGPGTEEDAEESRMSFIMEDLQEEQDLLDQLHGSRYGA